MSTERAAAPPRWYAVAMRAASKSAAEHAFAGRSLLDFRDDGGRARAQGRAKIAARGETQFGLGLPLVEPWDAAGKLFALPGDNSGQDVWNGAGQG